MLPLNAQTITGITSQSTDPIELAPEGAKVILRTELISQNNADPQPALELFVQCGESGQIITSGANFAQSGVKWTSINSISEMVIPCNDRIFMHWNPTVGGGEMFYSISYVESTTSTSMNITNPTQDIAAGLFLFFVVFFGLIFYFRSKEK